MTICRGGKSISVSATDDGGCGYWLARTPEERLEAIEIQRFDGIEISIISLADLRANKAAAGRHKDLDDLEHLPASPDDSKEKS